MYKINYKVPQHLNRFVNCIMVDESDSPDSKSEIPIYADGYPGIMFQQSDNGFYQQPSNKKLSELFLYGQTITPFTLNAVGRFNFVVVQLYPFASKYLLNIDPKKLNDDCYDLMQLNYIDINTYHKSLAAVSTIDEKVAIIYKLITELIEVNQIPEEDAVQKAIQIILENNGLIKVSELVEQLFLTERTLERNFIAQVGLTPKQFAKIIQFQTSLNNLNESKSGRLTDVGQDTGFADQSHFIRTFKKYTGLTPSYYLQQMAS